MRRLLTLAPLLLLLTLGLAPVQAGDGLDSEKAIDVALRITSDDDEEDAARALAELRKLGEGGVRSLLDAARDADDEEFETLSDALVALGKDAVPVLVRTLADGDVVVVSLAVTALDDLGKVAVPALLDVLQKGLEKTSDQTDESLGLARFRAAALLEAAGDDAIPGLVAIVKAGPQQPREVAAAILVHLGEPAIKPLVAILDGAAECRECARASLLLLGASSEAAGKAVCKETIDLLGSKNADLRSVAVQTVGTFGDAESVKVIVDRGLSSDDDRVRESAADCAALLGEPAIEPLLRCLSGDKRVALAAANALARIQAAVPKLEASLADPVPQVRAYAALALGGMGRKLSIEKIVPLLDDPEKDVKEAALRALQVMTDEKLATRAEWEDYWKKHRAEFEEEALKAAEAKKAPKPASSNNDGRSDAPKKP
jgi:HEAT repeat protein